MRKIIAIVGNSGCGKDTLAKLIESEFKIPQIKSYTTRKKRTGETDEHIFISIDEFDTIKQNNDFFAYTLYGGNHYFTTEQQILNCNKMIYVIDEAGIFYLKEKIKEPKFKDLEICFVNVIASKSTRLKRGVSLDRMRRDHDRVPFDKFDVIIENNSTIDNLKKQLNKINKFL